MENIPQINKEEIETWRRMDLKTLGSWPTDYAQKSPRTPFGPYIIMHVVHSWKRKEKITPVWVYRRECEPVGITLITVFRDAMCGFMPPLSIVGFKMRTHHGSFLYRYVQLGCAVLMYCHSTLFWIFIATITIFFLPSIAVVMQMNKRSCKVMQSGFHPMWLAWLKRQHVREGNSIAHSCSVLILHIFEGVNWDKMVCIVNSTSMTLTSIACPF